MDASGALVVDRLVTPVGIAGLRGTDLGEPREIAPAAVAWSAGRITYVGEPDGLPSGSPTPTDHRGRIAVPGFVDAHTHLPFRGWRADEFEARLAGTTYRDLQGRGGGIHRSARMLSDASDAEVLAFSRALLDEALAHGTTTLECKTGYGLSVEAELRQARLARALATAAPSVGFTVTLLAGHAVPEDSDRDAWISLACDDLIPRAAGERLVDAVDLYVEDIAFGLADLERVAAAAMAAGLPLRCHADQLADSGAAAAAVHLGARSVDHLNHISEAGIAAVASSDTVALLLPASTFSMRARPAPARRLIDAGAVVAIATDANPGTSAVISMPEVIAMACVQYGMTPHEALTAATLNAAAALGMAADTGSLEVGKRADIAVIDAAGFREVPYRPGHDPVVATIAGGVTMSVTDGAGSGGR